MSHLIENTKEILQYLKSKNFKNSSLFLLLQTQTGLLNNPQNSSFWSLYINSKMSVVGIDMIFIIVLIT